MGREGSGGGKVLLCGTAGGSVRQGVLPKSAPNKYSIFKNHILRPDVYASEEMEGGSHSNDRQHYLTRQH